MVVGCVGTGYVLRVELPVQRRLCPIFVRDVGSPGIHERFCGLTSSQRTPRIWGVTTEATPWRDRVKASSTGRTPDLLRSDSLRMDETTPAASSTLKSKESPSPSASGLFPLNSSALDEGGAALYAGGLQTVMGMTFNGGSVAFPEESLAFVA